VVLLPAVIYLALHVLGWFHPSWLWGADQFHYYPSSLLGVAIVSMICCIVWAWRLPATSPAASAVFERVADTLQPMRTLIAAALLGGFLLLAWTLRVRGHFLGDSGMWFANMELMLQDQAASIQWIIGLPLAGLDHVPALQGLDFLLHYHTYRLGHAMWDWTPSESYLFWSLLAGVPYLAILWQFARRLHTDPVGRLTVFGMLATLGTTQFFFGYGESYTLVHLLVALYALLGLRLVRGEVGLWYPSLCLLVAVSLHMMALSLLPSWVYLVWRDQGRLGAALRQPRWHRPLLALASVAALWFYVAFYRFHHPRIWQPEVDGRYALLSIPHLANLANELLLISPFGLVWGLVLSAVERRRGQRPDEDLRFVGWAALGTSALVCVHNVAMGGRDWDLMAFPGLPLALWGLLHLLRSIHSEGWLCQARLTVLPMMLAHTGLFIGINASPQRSMDRLGNLFLHTPNQARYYQEYTRGHYHLNIRQGEYEQAVRHLRKAVALYPGEAPQRYTQFLNRALIGLGGDYFAAKRLQEAVAVCEEAIQFDPTYSEGFYNLGLIRLTLGDNSEAAEAFRSTIRLSPQHARAHYGLGMALLRQDDLEGATRVLDALLELSPELARQLGAHVP